MSNNSSTRNVALLAVAAVVGLFGLIAFFGSFTIVDKGNVGVRMEWGAVQEAELEAGWNWKMPFRDSVEEMSTRLVSYGVKNAAASSRDLQTVTTTISVQHYLVPSKASDALQNVGDITAIDANVVDPAVLESLKAVTSKYSAEDLVTKRDEVKAKVTKAIIDYIEHTLSEKGISGALHVDNVAIEEFKFSDEFNNSIELKVKAEQEALKAENEKTRKITDAEAEAREKELFADAESYAIEVTSKSRAAAIEREAKSLQNHPELIDLRLTEQWNGKLPVYSSGGTLPFIGGAGKAPAGK